MPYLDRQNRICGFLDIEENENSGKFYRRYFILDALRNSLLWYMDNPQNLPEGANNVGSLRLSYISKVPKIPAVTQSTDAATVISQTQATSRQAYKTEIVGGVVVHTPVQQNEADDVFIAEPASHVTLKSCQSLRPNVVRSGYCVKQGNVRKSWKRRFFILDEQHVSYYKNETDKDALRSIRLRDIQKVHECLVKSGELLSRDNLFEIITSTRTFYIQTDTPEEMNGWIKDIGSKIQDFRGPSKVKSNFGTNSLSFTQTQSYRFSGSGQGKPPLLKSCSVVQSWQPWTPVPKQTTPQKEEELRDSSFCSLPSLSRPGERLQSQVRQRHHSQPQPASKHTDFPMDTDVHVRTTDV
uniref:PH domain-containing protein n=1 Tax=Electrophorus electricus TaxID=8005 RepID=A0A4W4H7V0_ELEEL